MAVQAPRRHSTATGRNRWDAAGRRYLEIRWILARAERIMYEVNTEENHVGDSQQFRSAGVADVLLMKRSDH